MLLILTDLGIDNRANVKYWLYALDYVCVFEEGKQYDVEQLVEEAKTKVVMVAERRVRNVSKLLKAAEAIGVPASLVVDGDGDQEYLNPLRKFGSITNFREVKIASEGLKVKPFYFEVGSKYLHHIQVAVDTFYDRGLVLGKEVIFGKRITNHLLEYMLFSQCYDGSFRIVHKDPAVYVEARSLGESQHKVTVGNDGITNEALSQMNEYLSKGMRFTFS